MLLFNYYIVIASWILIFIYVPMLAIIFALNILDKFLPFLPFISLGVPLTCVLLIPIIYFVRTLIQCRRLKCFLAGKPVYYVMILEGMTIGIIDSSIIYIITYYVLRAILMLDFHASLLLALIPSISTFIFVVIVYFRGPWYIIFPFRLPAYFKTGVSNPFQWYLRERGRIENSCRFEALKT